jgi:hypothetical protein
MAQFHSGLVQLAAVTPPAGGSGHHLSPLGPGKGQTT